MQINLNKISTSRLIPYVAISLLIIYIFVNQSCHRDSTAVAKIEIPEQKGSFELQFPLHDTIQITKYLPKIDKSNNDKLKQDILGLIFENQKLKDSFKLKIPEQKIISYDKAIELKSFSSTFEDSVIKIKINGIVQGEVKQVASNYTIKAKQVIFTPKETVFRLLGGLEVGNNKQLDNFTAKALLGVQNRKGNIISISADSRNNFFFGYQFYIFNIQR